MFRHPVRTFLVIMLLLTASERSGFAARAETWIEVRSPNFLVLTDANEKQGRRVALQFEMIRAVFRQLFGIQGSAKDPTVTIIAAKDEDDLKVLLPEFWAKKGLAHPAGIYLGGPEKNYIALRLDVAMQHEGTEPFESIYHEYVHFLTRRMIARLPLWMVEGLAEFYGNTKLEGRRIFVGAPSSSNLEVLHESEFLPLNTLFAVNASSPYYHEESKTSIFYAESWLLTHYLITRDWREQTHHLNDFVQLLAQNVGPEEAARRTIGETGRLQEELEQYTHRHLYTAAGLPVPPALDAGDFTAEPASAAESLALRGDFMAHDHHYAEAREMLEAALKLEPKLAAACESMGLVFMEQDKAEEAKQWYARAVSLNSQSYLANYYYGTSLLKEQRDEAATSQAESSLRAAIRIAPDFAPAYEALATLLAGRSNTMEEAYRMATAAVSLEPGNVSYRLNAARVLEMMGRADDAVRVAQFAVSIAQTPDERREAEADLAMAQQHQAAQKQQREEQEAFKRAQVQAALSASQQRPPRPSGTAGAPQLAPRDAETAEAGSDLPDHPSRPELETKPDLAEGIVEKAECTGGTTIEVTLKVQGGELHLYSDRYLKILYSALNFTPKGILNPCKELKGWRARISYRPAKGDTQQGEMMGVVLIKD
jgi:tetratricopeptide (TPR) repeat protein